LVYENPDPSLVFFLSHIRPVFEACLDEIKHGGVFGESFLYSFFG
jgi:hypothetical protein